MFDYFPVDTYVDAYNTSSYRAAISAYEQTLDRADTFSDNQLFSLFDYSMLSDITTAYQRHKNAYKGLADVENFSAKDVAEMVQNIRNVFGLNNVQVSRLVGVSRPSLYNHISGKEQPKSLKGYSRLSDLADAVRESVDEDIRPGLKSILVDGKTLLAHLKESSDEKKLVDVSIRVAHKLRERGAKMPNSIDLKSTIKQNTISG